MTFKVKDLFVETKKVIASYKQRLSDIESQEHELDKELTSLQSQLTRNLADQGGAAVSELVYLKIQAKELSSKIEVIKELLQEILKQKTTLKLEFTPIFKTALQNDRPKVSEYNATQIAEKYRYLMLKEISEIGEQMQGQYIDIAGDIYSVFNDPAVVKEFPRLEYSFHSEQYVPFFGWFGETVISKNDIFAACSGRTPTMPGHMTNSKGGK